MTTRKKTLLVALLAITIGIAESINHVYRANVLRNEARSKEQALRAEQIHQSTSEGKGTPAF